MIGVKPRSRAARRLSPVAPSPPWCQSGYGIGTGTTAFGGSDARIAAGGASLYQTGMARVRRAGAAAVSRAGLARRVARNRGNARFRNAAVERCHAIVGLPSPQPRLVTVSLPGEVGLFNPNPKWVRVGDMAQGSVAIQAV